MTDVGVSYGAFSHGVQQTVDGRQQLDGKKKNTQVLAPRLLDFLPERQTKNKKHQKPTGHLILGAINS